MSSHRPAALLLLPLLALLAACPGREDDPPVFEDPRLPELTLPEAHVGATYSASVAASGGSAPLRYTLEGLPPGLTYEAATGALSGTATQGGEYQVRATVVDARGGRDEQRYMLWVIPPLGEGTSLLVANWNVEWFGDPNNGPYDDALQLQNVGQVMRSVGADVWALQEVVDVEDFAALKAQLPGYDGFVSNDARVSLGAQYYATDEQKLALLFRSDRVQLVRAELVRPDRASLFAGRPPLRVDLRVGTGGATTELTVIVVHLKAFAGTTEFEMRRDEATVLKEYLDQHLPLQRVLVLGDWNDDLDASIATPNPTPFQGFLDDPADSTFITKPLTDSRQSTTVGYPDPIDHQLASNELRADYVGGSLAVVRPSLPGYGNNTSDHYPVTSRYALPAP